jgi:hypothetical protein
MRQTVIGVFDSYVDAQRAQRALIDAGLQQNDMSVYSTAMVRATRHGPRAYAHGAGDAYQQANGSGEQRDELERVERLFARLFRHGSYPAETEDYREVIRRGGAIVSIDVADTQVEAAQNAMQRMGAVDIGELAAAWRRDDSLSRMAEPTGRVEARAGAYVDPVSGAARSRADDTGNDTRNAARESIGGLSDQSRYQTSSFGGSDVRPTEQSGAMNTGSGAPGSAALRPDSMSQSSQSSQSGQSAHAGSPSARLYARTPADQPLREDRASYGMNTNMNGGPLDSEPGQSLSGSPITRGADLVTSVYAVRTDVAGSPTPTVPKTGNGPGAGASTGAMSDGEHPYEGEFRNDYDSRYASTGSPYEDYKRAYLHGARAGQDARYQSHAWPDVEEDVRQHWESENPDSGGWERFKAAVRHGWERVTGKD